MAPFNAELACKALETRVGGIERAIDALRKATQAGTIEARLAKLESVVKVQAETRSASKVDAMEKTLKALDAAKLIDQDTLRKAMNANEDKRQAQQDADAKKQADEAKRSAQAIVDKAVADIQKQVDAAKLESRLQALEIKVNVALAKT